MENEALVETVLLTRRRLRRRTRRAKARICGGWDDTHTLAGNIEQGADLAASMLGVRDDRVRMAGGGRRHERVRLRRRSAAILWPALRQDIGDGHDEGD